jgi:hypothetical protein
VAGGIDEDEPVAGVQPLDDWRPGETGLGEPVHGDHSSPFSPGLGKQHRMILT